MAADARIRLSSVGPADSRATLGHGVRDTGSMISQPEPWLRGTHADLPSAIRAVTHALELCREDIDEHCGALNNAELNARPAQVAPIAFHLPPT